MLGDQMDETEKQRSERRQAFARMTLASRLGPLALLRLRAEVVLRYGDSGNIPLTPAERETLNRIAVAPVGEDKGFLDGFDRYYEQWE